MIKLSEFRKDVLELTKESGDLYQKLAYKYHISREEVKKLAFPILYSNRGTKIEDNPITSTKVHDCDRGTKEEDPHNWANSLENRGDGWYLYLGDLRGDNPCSYCPWCGEKLEGD